MGIEMGYQRTEKCVVYAGDENEVLATHYFHLLISDCE